MKIILRSRVFILTVFFHSIELSSQTDSGHNLDLNLRLGTESTTGPISQSKNRVKIERKLSPFGTTPLGPGRHVLPLRRKPDDELSMSLLPPSSKLLRSDQHDKAGIPGRKKVEDQLPFSPGKHSPNQHDETGIYGRKTVDDELSLSLAPPGSKILRPNQHDKTGVQGREKVNDELSLSLAPPSHKIIRPYRHDQPGISGLPRNNRYPVFRFSNYIFYEAAPKDFRLIVGSVPVVVKGRCIIGRFDHGYLRPIYNHSLQVIKIGKNKGVPFHAIMSEAEMAACGMNKPINPDHTVNYRPPVPDSEKKQQN